VAATHLLEGPAADSRLSAPVIVLIGICSLIYLLDGLIHSILGPLAPDMARSLGLSNAQLGPVFSANLVGQCVGLVAFPALASRLGQRNVVIFSLGGIVAALGVGLLIDRFGAMRTLVTFVAISTALLFAVGRVLETASAEVLLTLLGACGFFVLGAYGGVNVVLADAYPEYLRATGIGWAKSVGRIGTVIAPILIGFGLSAGIAGSTIMSWLALPASLAVLALIVLAFATKHAV
jgi:MFS family permease